MTRRIEYVPNFSVGRRKDVIKPMVSIVCDVPGMKSGFRLALQNRCV
ncbi:MAG: hypothetical protein ACOX00_02865 [Peptoniphilaceae bacterium]|jgi:glutamate formiminotransferase